MLVYSHDTFGLGNIRRMLAICEHLHARIPGLSVLILTGSPMLHSFRLVDGIDYVKLPCLRRDGEGSIRVKYLNINLDSTVRLRRKLIHSTVTHFRPDILLVDKKPGGVVGELEETLKTIKTDLPHTAVVLLLRDILDDAAVTIAQWKRQSAYKLLEDYYHKILVAGLPELYDVREEYQFPASLRAKVHFCGYVGRKASPRTREAIRRELQIDESDHMILVTAGGGEDGYGLIRTYLTGIADYHSGTSVKTLIVTGPELAESHKSEVRRLANRCSHVRVLEFTDEMMSYMNAADVVVGMGGYNTICEILSLRKRAVIVPRVTPVQEQKIRAERMARINLFKMIHPDDLTPQTLMMAVMGEMEASRTCPQAPASIELDGLPRIGSLIGELARRAEMAPDSRAFWRGSAARESNMKIAYLLKTFPKLSETFVLNEILELERQGLGLHIFSLREPSETKRHAGVAQVKAGITYIRRINSLPALYRVPFEKLAQKIQVSNDRRFVFLRHPIRYLRTLFFNVRQGGRRRYFEEAVGLARELRQGGFTHLHAHFANEPTSVAELAHRLTGCPFSFTAHAKDIYLEDGKALARKIAAAEFVITCTGFNRAYLADLAAEGARIHLCYHGVDLSRFSLQPGQTRDTAQGVATSSSENAGAGVAESYSPARGARLPESSEPPVILSVGRFCEKKGFPYLIQACHRLKHRGRRFACRIVGFGPLQEQLEELIRTLELGDSVFLVGKMTQEKLIQEYQGADLFALPCLVTDDGDRDGIPNVLVEAMAMRIPVVSTAISGIGELVDHMEDGLLVPEKETEALAAAIEMLLDDPQLRDRLGANARRKVMDRFSLDRSTAKVHDLLLEAAEKAQPAHPVEMTEAEERHLLARDPRRERKPAAAVSRASSRVPLVSQELPPS